MQVCFVTKDTLIVTIYDQEECKQYLSIRLTLIEYLLLSLFHKNKEKEEKNTNDWLLSIVK